MHTCLVQPKYYDIVLFFLLIKMDATKSSDLVMLEGVDFPLSSMSLIGLVGSTGSGKTF